MKKITIQNTGGSRTVVDGVLKVRTGAPQVGICTLVSDTPDRKLVGLDYYTQQEIDRAGLNTDIVEDELGQLDKALVRSINGISPASGGDFFVLLDACMSILEVPISQSVLSVADYCPACGYDCDRIESLKSVIRNLRFELNAVKDAMLPYGQQQFLNRMEYAKQRFDQPTDSAITKAMDIISRYVKIVNMMNFVTLTAGKGVNLSSVTEDTTGITVQMVHAFPAIREHAGVSASLTIEPDDVSDVDSVSVLVVGAPYMRIISQDGKEKTRTATVQHISSTKKKGVINYAELSMTVPCVMNFCMSFIPFFYIKAADTSGRENTLSDIDWSSDKESAGSSAGNGFIYSKSTVKTGLDIPVSITALQEATESDYSDSKLYPTRNVDGTDRWKFTLKWSIITDSGETAGNEVYYFETSKVKQPVHGLSKDSTWITGIAVQ